MHVCVPTYMINVVRLFGDIRLTGLVHEDAEG